MDRATKIAIAGLASGCVVAGLGLRYSAHLESEAESARAECVAESEREALITGSYGALAAQYGGKSVCDPVVLRQLEPNGALPGAQGHLLQASRDFEAWKPWPILIGALIAFLSALPWAWYFVLRRIAELRKAAIGK